jgi:hypothetical protein
MNAFEARFNERPTDDDVAIAQRDFGYPLDAFGPPERVHVAREPNGEWTATWACDALPASLELRAGA